MKINPSKVRQILARNILADGFQPIIDLEKSHGSWIVDQRNGDKYLDMFSMYASGAIGYNHPEILKNKERLMNVALNKTTLSDIYNVEYAIFMDIFDSIAAPDYLKKAFFIDGGALAVENALKIAFDWKTRKNFSKNIKKEASKIIHFKDAFHGRSGYTLSLTNTDPVKTMYFPKFDWPRIVNPTLTFPITDDVIKHTEKLEKNAIKQIISSLNDNKHEIAGLIIEPIQAEGGDKYFRQDFFNQLVEICEKYDILFICDEVQTGVGITAKMWAHEHYSIKPDIVAFGKKTQVCGVIAGSKIDEVDSNVFQQSSRINSTFGGNLVDMVRFGITLEVIKNENLLDRVYKNGKYLLNQLNQLSDEFPGMLTNPRALGLFAAFDMPSNNERRKLLEFLYEDKLIILACGERSVRFRPHLNVKESELEQAIVLIKKNLLKLLK